MGLCAGSTDPGALGTAVAARVPKVLIPYSCPEFRPWLWPDRGGVPPPSRPAPQGKREASAGPGKGAGCEETLWVLMKPHDLLQPGARGGCRRSCAGPRGQTSSVPGAGISPGCNQQNRYYPCPHSGNKRIERRGKY